MADDTARIAHGPQPDPAAHDTNATADPAPNFAEYLEVIGDAGARHAAVAREDPGELVGAAAGGREAGRTFASGVAVEDAPPPWSFREGAARTSRLPLFANRAQTELPFGTAETMRPATRPQPMFGPVGRARSPLAVPLLAAVTLGVFALSWTRRISRELEDFDPQLTARPARSVVALAVPWLLGLLATVAGAAALLADRVSIHLPSGVHVGSPLATALLAGLLVVPYLTLVLPFSLVSVVMTLERIRCVEEHIGTTSDRQVRPVGTSLLLAIPVIGGLLLLATEQRRVNAIWDSVAPAGLVLS